MPNTLLPLSPIHVLFSGGKDSFACAKVLQEAGLLKSCIIMDTGIAADTWLEDVTSICLSQGWQWRVIPTPTRYEWFVWRYGFPGPGMHGAIMNYLKGRCIREFKKDFPTAALASGVRTEESSRRSFNTKFESVFEGVTVYAPLLHWSTPEVWSFVRTHGYVKPRTYITLGISGDCLCGAFALPHERQVILDTYPIAAKKILRCELITGETWGMRSTSKIKSKTPLESIELICHDCSRNPLERAT